MVIVIWIVKSSSERLVATATRMAATSAWRRSGLLAPSTFPAQIASCDILVMSQMNGDPSEFDASESLQARTGCFGSSSQSFGGGMVTKTRIACAAMNIVSTDAHVDLAFGQSEQRSAKEELASSSMFAELEEQSPSASGVVRLAVDGRNLDEAGCMLRMSPIMSSTEGRGFPWSWLARGERASRVLHWEGKRGSVGETEREIFRRELSGRTTATHGAGRRVKQESEEGCGTGEREREAPWSSRDSLERGSCALEGV